MKDEGTRNVLSLDHVSKRYKDARAVENVSLDVQEGEFLALLGPSGAGKSTTLRLIAGLEMPDEGDIRIRGRSVSTMPAHRRDIGLVFQSYALFPHMSVANNIAFPLHMRGVASADSSERVDRALDLVQLSGLGRRKPAELSGGQQQRVALARALVFEPSLLLMDEPLAALDKKLREQLRSEVKSIQDRLGVTVVYVTHDQEEALSLADRIAVMHAGRIEQCASPREMYESPNTVFVAGFVGEGNFFDCTVTETMMSTSVVVETTAGIRLVGTPRSQGQMEVGERATYLVRPERLSINRTSEIDRGHNRLDVEVLQSFYFGQTTSYRVRLTNSDSVLKVVVADGASKEYEAGDRCTVTWSDQDGLILSGESKAAISEIAGLQ